jgi:molybdopterin-containing oxidoreductase family iron-sulfur binding subunit
VFKENGEKTEMVFVGPRLSLTGQNADEWVPIRPGSEATVALAMAAAIVRQGGNAGPYAPILQEYEPAAAAEAAGVTAEAIESLAERFASAAPSLALGPGVAGQHRNATAANLAALILNSVAGNVGRTVFVQSASAQAARPYAELEAGIRSMAAGAVGVAMVHGANPAYTLPPASGFVDAFRNVAFKVSFASSPDETAALADLILPDRHFLEAWGDSGPRPGVYAIQQPVMQPVPMFDTKQTGDVLASVATRMGANLGAATFYDHLRTSWQALHAGGARVSLGAQAGQPIEAGDAPASAPAGAAQAGATDFETFWRGALRRGVVETTVAAGPEAQTLRAPDTALTFDAPALDGEGLEFTLVVHPSGRFGDGARNGNRPWLLELPDPVSKITWHSWVELHPDAAARLDVRNGDIVTVTSPHGSLEAPVWIYPGIRDDVVSMTMGLGHTATGRFGDGNGVNPMTLLPAVAEQPSGGLVHLATRVSIQPTGLRMRSATIAGSDDQHGRPIAMAISLDELSTAGTAEAEEHEPLRELNQGGGFVPIPTEGRAEDFPIPGSRYGEYAEAEQGPRWAMVVDLDKCTGCSACVVACQAENNVPWVGEEQVRMGRDMAWIRLDRFYEHVDAHAAGPVDVRHLPMMCQHCNNAPCEPVCPVFAAYHTPDGINAQVYNRCVGTRYCANNCPYKVRVFNWYTFTNVAEPLNWQYNPDVTVRENGVMEKCTFCVQRVREAQNRAALEGGRSIADNEVVPACQQTCPAEAIVFGNIRNPASQVAELAGEERAYRALDELINTQPGVTYLRKVTFHAVESGAH